MISRFSRSSRLAGTAALSLFAIVCTRAQVTSIEWLGVDSNYLNSANWVTILPNNTNPMTGPVTLPPGQNVAPGAAFDLVFTATPANKVINLSHTAAGDVTHQIYAMRAGVSLAYTLNLSGNANGWLNYNIVGRGTHAFSTDPIPAGTGTSTSRLPFYMNVGPYTRITFAGSPATVSGGVSGLTLAKIRLTGNSIIDGSAVGGSLLEIGGLNAEVGTSVYMGMKALTISGSNAAGEEEIWAGRIYQDPTNVTATQKWGGGTTRVATTGVVDLPGEFRLRANGQYLVDGVHNGRITGVAAGSVIGGTGVINGPSITNTSNTVRPLSAVTTSVNTSIAPAGRNAFGLLTINGHVTHNGTLSFELDSPTIFDRLHINGDLVIGPTGTLAVGVTEAFPLQPGTYRLLTISGTNWEYDTTAMSGSFVPNAIEGMFSSVALPSSQGLAASYTMGSNYLDVTFTQLAFGTNPQLFGNHQIIASHIDAAVLANTTPLSLLDTLNRAPSIILFREILDQLSPTAYQSWFPSAVVRTNSMIQTLDDHQFQDGRLGRANGSMSTFFQGYRQESSKDMDEHAAYSNYDTMAALGGFDYVIGEKTAIGGFVNYETTDFDLDVTSGTTSVESITGGAYARHKRGPLQVNAVGFAGTDEYESRRSIQRTKLGRWADSETKGTRYGTSVTAAYQIDTAWLEVSPLVGLQWMSWDAKAFRETGSNGANLRVKYQSESSLASRVGFRLARSFDIKAGTLRPFVNVAWQHEFRDGERSLSAELFGGTYSIKAPGIGANGFRVDAGLDWNVSKTASLNVRYITEQRGAADESVGVRGGVTVAF